MTGSRDSWQDLLWTLHLRCGTGVMGTMFTVIPNGVLLKRVDTQAGLLIF